MSARENRTPHPWKKWLSRKRVTLKQGKDFTCQPHSLAVQARNWASRLNRRISVSIDGTEVTITVLTRKKK